MAKLEEIVAKLERDDVSLEEALRVYEEGVIIAKRCFSFLEDVRRRIEVMGDNTGEGNASSCSIGGNGHD